MKKSKNTRWVPALWTGFEVEDVGREVTCRVCVGVIKDHHRHQAVDTGGQAPSSEVTEETEEAEFGWVSSAATSFCEALAPVIGPLAEGM